MICVEEVSDNANEQVPPNVIVSYFDVYQKWPEGYPPKIEDYKQDNTELNRLFNILVE